ncbi:MAG: class I SAM-dependent methyltransferase [Chloroflexota bacterium]
MTDTPRICDYEGSDYRTDFWEGQGRNYEDRVERGVLRHILPESGKRLLELGAGFGRLTREYDNYDHVVLLDYSFSQLQYARQQLGDERFTYVAADAYHLPFKPAVFDGATMIRVIHHFEDVPRVLSAIRNVMTDDSTFILEHANKRNIKAMTRHALGQQGWNPHTLNPVEFVELNFNFHPRYIQGALHEAGFDLHTQIPVSFLRSGLLKRTLPAGFLAGIDSILQETRWLVSPSIFTLNTASGDTGANNIDLPRDAIFASPHTRSDLQRDGDSLIDDAGTRWEIRDGIYDFKAPVRET